MTRPTPRPSQPLVVAHSMFSIQCSHHRRHGRRRYVIAYPLVTVTIVAIAAGFATILLFVMVGIAEATVGDVTEAAAPPTRIVTNVPSKEHKQASHVSSTKQTRPEPSSSPKTRNKKGRQSKEKLRRRQERIRRAEAARAVSKYITSVTERGVPLEDTWEEWAASFGLELRAYRMAVQRQTGPLHEGYAAELLADAAMGFFARGGSGVDDQEKATAASPDMNSRVGTDAQVSRDGAEGSGVAVPSRAIARALANIAASQPAWTWAARSSDVYVAMQAIRAAGVREISLLSSSQELAGAGQQPSDGHTESAAGQLPSDGSRQAADATEDGNDDPGPPGGRMWMVDGVVMVMGNASTVDSHRSDVFLTTCGEERGAAVAAVEAFSASVSAKALVLVSEPRGFGCGDRPFWATLCEKWHLVLTQPAGIDMMTVWEDGGDSGGGSRSYAAREMGIDGDGRVGFGASVYGTGSFPYVLVFQRRSASCGHGTCSSSTDHRGAEPESGPANTREHLGGERIREGEVGSMPIPVAPLQCDPHYNCPISQRGPVAGYVGYCKD